MQPRTILHTGKGGAGTTAIAAATAQRLAATGRSTLLLSIAAPGGLEDVLGVELGDDPVALGEHLTARQLRATSELERHWDAADPWLGDLLVQRGIDRISAAEVRLPPGAPELFGLLELRRAAESGDHDVIVVDCAASAETLRLLAFP